MVIYAIDAKKWNQTSNPRKECWYQMRGFFARSMRLVALLMVTCLLWLPSSGIAAAAKQPTPKTELTEAEKQLVDTAANFTQYTNQGIVFDKDGALNAGLPESFVNDMARMYHRMNQKAARDNFQWDKLVESINARKSNPQQVTPGTDSGPGTEGRQWTKPGTVEPEWSTGGTWYYVQLTLNEWETQLIINALWTGAGAAGVYAALSSLGIVTLPYAGVVGLVAAILAFGAGYLGFVDTLGHNNGIYFRLYVTGSIFVWHN